MPDEFYRNAVDNVGASLVALAGSDESKAELAAFVLNAASAKIHSGSQANDPQGFILSGQFDDFVGPYNHHYLRHQNNVVGIRKVDDGWTISIGGRGEAVKSFDISAEDSHIVHDIRGLFQLTEGAKAKSDYVHLGQSQDTQPGQHRKHDPV